MEKSLVYKNVKYSAPSDQDGFIIASDISTNKTLWSKRIYKEDSNLNEGSEKSCKRCTIDDLKIEEDNLLIKNEDNEIYYLDINTRILSKKT